MKKLSLAILFTSTALIPAAFAQTNSNVDVANIDDTKVCGELVRYVNQNETDATGVTADRANTIASGQDPKICRDAFLLATGEKVDREAIVTDAEKVTKDQAAADKPGTEETADAEASADIEVAVPDPQVDVQQASPQVTVDQPKPKVAVTPGQPIVTVTQAEPVVHVETTPPTVTIDMPKPQILVEMPDPSVDVSMAQPRVSVTQPQPTVKVTQGEVKLAIDDEKVAKNQGEAKVRVQQQDATVQVNEAEGTDLQVAKVQPEVRYNATKPRVEVSETGEPKIAFNQSGEANVEFRQMSADETREAVDARAEMAAGQQDDGEERTAAAVTDGSQTEDTNAQAAVRGQDENREAQSAAANTDAAATGTDSAMASNTATTDAANSNAMTVDQLINKSVIGANGDNIGDVEDLVDHDGKTFLVVGVGGFLGIGEKQVAIPMDDIVYRNDELVSPSLTEETVEQMAEPDPDNYRPLGRDANVDVVIQ